MAKVEPQGTHRTPISSVRRAALLASVTAGLTVPLAALTLGGSDESPDARRHIAQRTPTGIHESSEGLRLEPAMREASLPPSVRGARATVERARLLPQEALLNLAASGTEPERLVALNVLWARGARAEVEAVVARSGSRALEAKLVALRNRR